jgi:hypothetical protein
MVSLLRPRLRSKKELNNYSIGKRSDDLANNIKDGDKIFLDNNANANRDSLYQKFANRESDKPDSKQSDKNTYKIRTKGF